MISEICKNTHNVDECSNKHYEIFVLNSEIKDLSNHYILNYYLKGIDKSSNKSNNIGVGGIPTKGELNVRL